MGKTMPPVIPTIIVTYCPAKSGARSTVTVTVSGDPTYTLAALALSVTVAVGNTRSSLLLGSGAY